MKHLKFTILAALAAALVSACEHRPASSDARVYLDKEISFYSQYITKTHVDDREGCVWRENDSQWDCRFHVTAVGSFSGEAIGNSFHVHIRPTATGAWEQLYIDKLPYRNLPPLDSDDPNRASIQF